MDMHAPKLQPTKWALMAGSDREKLEALDAGLVDATLYNTRAELYYRVYNTPQFDADAQREALRERLSKTLGVQLLSIDNIPSTHRGEPVLKVEVEGSAFLMLKTLEREREKHEGVGRS